MRLAVVNFSDLDISVSVGGLGKVQFGVQTQHLLDSRPDWDLFICAGAAGALVESLSFGDVVVSTESVEHDIRKLPSPQVVRFDVTEKAIAGFRSVLPVSEHFQVYFGPIASGDEDIWDADRRRALHELTGGLAVAWEGAGGARACRFSEMPFAEIRGIADGADRDAASDFKRNLNSVMANVAALIVGWARTVSSGNTM